MDSLLLAELRKAEESRELDEIAKLEAFSAVASGAASANDFKKLRFHLLIAGVSEEHLATDDSVRKIVHYIASQIVERARS